MSSLNINPGTPCQGAGGGGPGTRYTYAQLEALWIQNGGSSAMAPVMAAIAEAESGGCSSDINPVDNNGTQTSWGLWQISNGTHNQPTENILDPNVNAQQAVAKYRSQGLGAWGTYTSGAYLAFLNNNSSPDYSGTGSPAGNTSATLTASTADCLVAMPGGTAGGAILGGLPGALLGSEACLVTKSEARGVVGGALLIFGGSVALLGLLILAVYGFERTGAGRAASRVLAVTGAGRIVAGGITAEQAAPTVVNEQIEGPGRTVQRQSVRQGKVTTRRTTITAKPKPEKATEDQKQKARAALGGT